MTYYGIKVLTLDYVVFILQEVTVVVAVIRHGGVGWKGITQGRRGAWW